MIPPLSRRTSLVIGLAVVTVVGALFLEYLLSVRAARPFGHTQVAHLVGWTGLVFIGLTFVYPLKRWMYPNQVWSQRWFQVHMVFGIVGPLVVFVHAGVHFHAWVPIIALIAMVLVVMSGITGQALHYLAFRTLYERRHEVVVEGMTEEAIDAHLHDLALQEETLRWWKCLHGPLTWSFVSFTLLHIGGALFFGGF
ncbi:MAG: hypothetical protein OEZ41_03600 [Nitrospirota bacterium]|nr:hypothetical protein [Nitrospirota bacterium]